MSNDSDVTNKVAIVGRAGRFPSARNVREFWELLANERVGTTRLTDQELLARGVSRKKLADPNYVRAANMLPDMECFDAGFFGFSPKEAAILDPQHRQFLECAWEAFEDAGYVPESFDGRVGVFAGSGMQAYLPFNLLSNPQLVEEIGLFLLRHTGNDKDFLPTRLSYLLNLQGPSVAVQTACSTSLVAVHMGVNSLLNMESDMVIAGGSTVELPHGVGYTFQPNEIMSPDGYCRAFDDNSEGTVFGSGVSIVAMRRLEDALADGDDIKAVILGSAINNDGSQKANYLAPSIEGQAEAVSEALALAGVEADTITYIEAHGTGTNLGDPIELEALNEVFGDNAKESLGIGSVKTNIGHLDTAAGTTSLIKVIEALRHKTIPANLHFQSPNQGFNFADSPFRVVAKTEAWVSNGPRRAGVNSLGVGGTNAHVIVEEAPQQAVAEREECWRILPFSANSGVSLDGIGPIWREFIADDHVPHMADAAFTLRNGRRQFDRRMAVAARTWEDADQALAGDAAHYVGTGQATGTAPEIVFMFPGGGAQYPGAGAGLLKDAPAFANAVTACFDALPAEAPDDLYAMMFERTPDDEEASAKIGRSAYAIPALFILEYAYAKLFESWGVKPDAILAHSVGEYAGAVVAGAMSLSDALKVVTLRGKVMDAAPAGAMTTVPATEEKVREIIGDALDIAALNAPQLSVVSGTRDQIEALESRLRDTELETSRIHIDVAAHSRVLDGQLEPFREGFEGVTFGKTGVPFVSSMRGDWSNGEDFVTADYWVRHLRSTVRFVDAAGKILEKPDRIILEVGPGQSLGPLIGMMEAEHSPRAVIYSGRKPRTPAEDIGVAMAALGGLWANGVEIDWSLLPGSEGRRVSLPTYAFEKQRHWIEPGKGSAIAPETDDGEIELERIDDLAKWFGGFEWQPVDRAANKPTIPANWIVLESNAEICAAAISELEAAGASITRVRRGTKFAADGDGYTLRAGEPGDFERLLDEIKDAPDAVLSFWALDEPSRETAFDAPFGLLRALQNVDSGNPVKVGFVTTGATDAFGPVTTPLASLVKGPVRVGPREIPGLQARLIDLQNDFVGTDAAEGLLAEMLTESDGDVVALARTGALKERRVELVPGDETSSRIRDKGAYVITGGNGGIGRALAEWLAETHKANVALLSRSASESDEIVDRVATLGGKALCLAADVTDRSSVSGALEKVRAEFGEISGLFHAAGAIDDAPLALKSLEDAHKVMAPKVEGAQVLSDLFPEGSLDFFAVFSSTSVTVGSAGQTDYVAANAFLEALAASRSDGLAIAWGIWRDIGMAVEKYGSAGGDHGIHPLVGIREEKDNGEVIYARTLDPETLWVLKGHVVGGVKVLPGAAYLGMIKAGGEDLAGAGTEIQALSLGSPMVFPRDLPRTVRLRFIPTEDGHDVRVESAPSKSSDEWTEHARARLTRTSARDDSTDGLLPEPAKGAKVKSEAAQKNDIEFGPQWNNVVDIRVWENQSLGHLRLPEAHVSELSDYPLHPALMDTAATIGLSALSDEERTDVVYAPMSMQRVVFHAPLTGEVKSYARRRSTGSAHVVTFDVRITDTDGKSLLTIDGLDMRGLKGGSFDASEFKMSPTEILLSNGISSADAAEVFARALSIPRNRMIVSSMSVDLMRLSLTEASKPTEARPSSDQQVELNNPVETALAGIWAELLGTGSISADDDFFALGGHSLNAVRMFGRVRKEFDVDMRLATLFEASTLAKFAEEIIKQRPELANLVPALDAEAGPQSEAGVDLVPVVEDREFSTTQAQREVLSAIIIDPKVSCSYNLSYSLHVHAAVELEAVQRAVDDLVARRDSLRSQFSQDGLSVFVPKSATVEVELVDLSGESADIAEERAVALRRDAVGKAFDLHNGPAFRVVLVRYGEDRHEIQFCVHHVVCDGWSLQILQDEFVQLYQHHADGASISLEVPTSLAEYVDEEAAFLASPEAKVHADYWLDKFQGELPFLDLPTDRPRPPKKTTRAGYFRHEVDGALLTDLRAFANANCASVENLLFAAFNLYLGRLCGSRDVVLGLPASGQLAYGLDQVTGHCVSLLPVRNRIDGDAGFLDFLSQVRMSILEALDHQKYTYGNLIRDLKLFRDPSRVALLPIMFNIDNFDDTAGHTIGGAAANYEMNPRSNEYFDIFFNLLTTPDAIQLSWTFNADIFDENSIARHAERLEGLLQWVCRNPDRAIRSAPVLSDKEKEVLLGDWQGPTVEYPRDETIGSLFAAQVERAPDALAIIDKGQNYSIGQLDKMVRAAARQLKDAGVGEGDVVGVCLERSVELIAGMLAAARLGAAFAPLDPSNPKSRLQYVVEQSQARCVFTNGKLNAEYAFATPVLAEDAGVPLEEFPNVDPETTFYVPYTSGSTGQPKGVMIPHRSVVNRFYWMWREFPFEEGEVMCQKTAISFVDFLWETFGPILAGVPLLVIDNETVREPRKLFATLGEHGVTRLLVVPSLLRAILNSQIDLSKVAPKLKWLWTGGERLTPDMVERFLAAAPNITLGNIYGASEFTADGTFEIIHDLSKEHDVPIGRPLPNCRVYVLDADHNLVTVGRTGELYVGGDVLSNGYLHRPDLTAERFIRDPFADEAGALMFATGDLVRHLPDGRLLYEGRADDQIKVRGYRVELGEVEAALASLPEIQQAAVILKPMDDGNDYLSAFVTAAGDSVDVAATRKGLNELLPGYMVPSRITELEKLPLNPNGKIDRNALQDYAEHTGDGAGNGEPQTPTEERLLKIWRRVLGQKDIGTTANFFESGGHSLMAVDLFTKIRAKFGQEMPISTLFEHGNVRQLAALIEGAHDPSKDIETEKSGEDAPWDTTAVIHAGPETGAKPTLFIVGGVGGNVNNLWEFGQILGEERKVVGLQTRGVLGHSAHDTVEDMAADHINNIRRHQPEGPYFLAGYSGGSLTAFEMARQLEAAGDAVAYVGLIDYAPAPGFMPELKITKSERLRFEMRAFTSNGVFGLWRRIGPRLRQIFLGGERTQFLSRLSPEQHRLIRIGKMWWDAADRYDSGQYGGNVWLYLNQPAHIRFEKLKAADSSYGWRFLVDGQLHVEEMPFHHLDMMSGESVKKFCKLISRGLDDAAT